MRKYRSESHFSSELCSHLTNCGYFVQRIETGTTGRGVPDIYVGVKGGQYWIELKRMKQNMPAHGFFEVPWRPGQQRWMYKHYKHTSVPCFTFIAFDNCVCCLSNMQLFKGNIVHTNNALKIWGKVDEIRL